MAPTFGDGKICYLEIPAADEAASARFYGEAFGWHIRNDSDGDISFDDAVGEVSGTWVSGRPPHQELGILVAIMVFDLAKSIAKVRELGGSVLIEPNHESPHVLARISDPYGNVWCLYQHSQREQ